jgi:hypothetical protein
MRLFDGLSTALVVDLRKAKKRYQVVPESFCGTGKGKPKWNSQSLIRIGESKLPEHWRKKLDLWPGATWFDGIAASIIRAAVRGDVAAAREIREATEGKAPLHVELGGEIALTNVVKKVVEKAA